MSLAIKTSSGAAPVSLNQLASGLKHQGYVVEAKGDELQVKIPSSYPFLLKSWGTTLIVKTIFIYIRKDKLQLKTEFRSSILWICLVCLVSLFPATMRNASLQSTDIPKLLIIFSFGILGTVIIVLVTLMSSVKKDIKHALKIA